MTDAKYQQIVKIIESKTSCSYNDSPYLLCIDRTILFRTDLSPFDKNLYWVLCCCHEEHQCFVIETDLAAFFNVPEKRIKRSLANLQAKGLIMLPCQHCRDYIEILDGHHELLLDKEEASSVLGVSAKKLLALIKSEVIEHFPPDHFAMESLYCWLHFQLLSKEQENRKNQEQGNTSSN